VAGVKGENGVIVEVEQILLWDRQPVRGRSTGISDAVVAPVLAAISIPDWIR
jgi:hypothetical protein